MMLNQPYVDPDPGNCLAIAAALLARASDLTWSQAQSNPDAELRFQGLGLDLTIAQALELLPADANLDVVDPVQTVPLELVRSAEEALRRRPIEDFPAGTSQLIVAVCDLVREHAP